ncbi:MAG: type IV pilus modification protein PilV [Burkholderiaceae bacterium]|nr:type IV pilus modification protein PilV [Burkholderiaceae bacterium]
MRRAPGRRGIVLIEAMIAVLLLSMAALGYAAMQMRGLSGNAGAMWRSKATLLANDMADRLRANRSGVLAGNYNDRSGAATAPSCGSTSNCTPANMAALDHAQWNATIARELPGGSGAVCRDASPDDGTAEAPACDGQGDVFAVKLFWRERGEAARLSMAVRP